MGTQSYRPWGERLLSKHKLFLSQEGPAFSIATPSQILFSLFKRLPRLHVWCSKTVACGLLVAGLPGKISWPIIKSQLYHLHATFWCKRQEISKPTKSFRPPLFCRWKAEQFVLHLHIHHEHWGAWGFFISSTFLPDRGRQASYLGSVTPAWWLPWQSHREVNFAERFQEKFAKKKFATKCVRLCALIDLFKASCALHIFVRASFILCIYLYQHNKGLHIRTSVIWSAYILTKQVCISHQETPFVCTSNPAISCGC